MTRVAPLLGCLALLTLAPLAAAQPADDAAPGAELLDLSAQERSVLDDLEVIEIRLLVVHTEMQSLHVQERDLESHLVALDREVAAVATRLELRQSAVSDRARALYMNSEKGMLQLLFSARDPHELLVGGRYLSYALRLDERDLTLLHEEREWVNTLRDEREVEYGQLKARIDDRQRMQEEQRGLRQRRRVLLDKVRGERRALALAAVSSEAAEEALADATGGGDAAEEQATPAPATDDGVAAVEEMPAPSIGFARQQGRLIMPLTGDIFGTYGWYSIEGSLERAFRRGIHVEAAQGDPVRAVFAGQVRRAEWIRGFGIVVILDHGDRYFSVYAHLDHFEVVVGEMVTTGQVIGAAGETGSMSGPYLHFEIRHQGQPVDPLDWVDLPPGVQVRD